MAVYDLRVTVGTDTEMAELLRRPGVEVVATTIRREDGGYAARVIADDETARDLEAEGCVVEQLTDLTSGKDDALRQVGRGDSYPGEQ